MRGKYHMWSFTWNHWWDHLWISSWGKDLRKVDTTSADQRTEETESGTFKETARNVWVWWNQTSVRYSDRGGELDIPQRHPQQEVTLDVGGRKWVQTGGVSSRILEQNAIFFSFLFFLTQEVLLSSTFYLKKTTLTATNYTKMVLSKPIQSVQEQRPTSKSPSARQC